MFAEKERAVMATSFSSLFSVANYECHFPTSNIDAPHDGECADPHTLLGPAITFGFVFQLGE